MKPHRGADVRIVRVLLTTTDEMTALRLARRELGSGPAQELAGSAASWTGACPRTRYGRGVLELAEEVVGATGWVTAGQR
ncbi:hypothetical protein ACJ6WF_43095 [Streptomyces sp. MMS24-I2-30]|uniref:hypothetical protein n=1 Tax=Streptomyces sp. MMS24-I2-30 TaxID=3351564 RepID=UPI003896DE9A